MNDRFKFRVFSKTDEKVYPVWAITPLNVVLNTLGRENINIPRTQGILMQSTGLKDKNGKLIFEGDIVRFSQYHDPEGGDWEKSVVVWGDELDYPAFDLKHTDFGGVNGLHYIFVQDWPIEVIGNIYENKELLEGENGL